jgi:ABC-type Fe3+/spermidine/putrescine transport system ATPase subunit
VNPIVEFRNIVKSFGSTKAIDGLSFNIDAGECVALLGPSGCGKTTSLRLLAGFEGPTSGSLFLDGKNLHKLKPYERNLGLVFQDYALFPHMNVSQNIEYGMRRRGISPLAIETRRKELIKLVQLEGLAERRPAELSGGQQQRVAIARALAPRPTLLLLDEPLSNLDTRLRLTLRQGLRSILSSTGATTLLVTHDQEEAMSMADRIVILHKGRLQQQGPPVELYRYPANRFVAEFLGACLFFSVTPTGDAIGDRQDVLLDDGTLLKAVMPPMQNLQNAPRGVMIRPERIELKAEDAPLAPDTNRLKAIVVARAFLGASEELTLRLERGDVLHLREPATGRQTMVGLTVCLDFPAEACIITADTGS